MSSSNAKYGQKGLRLICGSGIIFGLALSLSGCIQPLYGPSVGGGSVASEMQSDQGQSNSRPSRALCRERVDFRSQRNRLVAGAQVPACRHFA